MKVFIVTTAIIVNAKDDTAAANMTKALLAEAGVVQTGHFDTREQCFAFVRDENGDKYFDKKNQEVE